LEIDEPLTSDPARAIFAESQATPGKFRCQRPIILGRIDRSPPLAGFIPAAGDASGLSAEAAPAAPIEAARRSCFGTTASRPAGRGRLCVGSFTG